MTKTHRKLHLTKCYNNWRNVDCLKRHVEIGKFFLNKFRQPYSAGCSDIDQKSEKCVNKIKYSKNCGHASILDFSFPEY